MKEIYKKKNQESIRSFKQDIRLFAKQEGLVMQETDESENSTKWVCQVKRDSKITLGVASKAITIIIDDFSDNTIKISVGQGKWLSKIAGASATALLTGPLFFLTGAVAALGAFGQLALTGKIRDLINVHFK